MKLFVKLIFVANFLFLGGGFLITFFQFIAYNGFGDIFEYVKPERRKGMCAAVGWGDVPQQAREACHSRQGEHATTS